MRKVKLFKRTHCRLKESKNKVLELLAADYAINNLDALLKTSEIQNEIEEADLAIQEPLQIILTSDERPNHDAKWRSYQYRKGDLQK